MTLLPQPQTWGYEDNRYTYGETSAYLTGSEFAVSNTINNSIVEYQPKDTFRAQYGLMEGGQPHIADSRSGGTLHSLSVELYSLSKYQSERGGCRATAHCRE